MPKQKAVEVRGWTIELPDGTYLINQIQRDGEWATSIKKYDPKNVPPVVFSVDSHKE